MDSLSEEVLDVFYAEQRQLPSVRSVVVSNEVRIAVDAFQFEVPVVGRQPCVKYLRNSDAMVVKSQCAWRLFAAMACVAFNTSREWAFVLHLNIKQLIVENSAANQPTIPCSILARMSSISRTPTSVSRSRMGRSPFNARFGRCSQVDALSSEPNTDPA